MHLAATSRVRSVASLVLVLALALGGVAWWYRFDVRDRTYSDDAFREAATTTAQLLLTPDFHDPTRARRILDTTTGTFRDRFAQSSDAYTDFVKQVGTVSSGTVRATAIADRDGDVARVLVLTEVTSTSTGGDGGPREFRVLATVMPDDVPSSEGALRVSDMEFYA